jgi:hypothetical protein
MPVGIICNPLALKGRRRSSLRTSHSIEALKVSAARPVPLVGVARAVFPRKRRSLRPMMAGRCWATRLLSRVRAGAWGLYSSPGRNPRSCSGTPVSSSVGRWIYRRSGRERVASLGLTLPTVEAPRRIARSLATARVSSLSYLSSCLG